MIALFLLFVVVGALVGKVITPPQKALLAIVIGAIVWSLVQGPFFGLITLGGLLLGFALAVFVL